MSITEILKQMDVTPGLSVPSPDPALRSSGKSAPNSDYRDKLARNLNDATRPENPPQQEPAPTASSSSESPPPARENPARGSIRKNSPQQPTQAAPAEDNSQAAQAPAQSPSGSSPETQAEIQTTATDALQEDELAADVSFEVDAPSADEISRNALALVAITTTTVPDLQAFDFNEPEAPAGLSQLLDALPTNLPLEPQVSPVDDLENSPLPPAGLLEALNIPGISVPETIVPAETDNKDVSLAVSENVATACSSQTPTGYEVVTTTPTVDVPTAIPVLIDETAAQLPVISVSTTAGQISEPVDPTPKHDSESDDLNSSAHTAERNSQTAGTTNTVTTVQPQVAPVATAPSPSEAAIHESTARSYAAVSSPQPPAPETQSTAPADTKAVDHKHDCQVSTNPPVLFDDSSSALQGTRPDQGNPSDSNGNDIAPTDDSGVNPLANAPRSEFAPALHHSQHTTTLSHADAHELVERVSTAVGTALQTGRALRVRLQPPELGVLQIEITSKDGLLTARLETQTSAAHQTIMESLSSLKEALAHVGSPVERIEVQVAENRGSDNLARHFDEQNDASQQQNSQRQQRGNDPQDEARPDDDAPATRRVSLNPIDQLDIQI